MAEWNIQVEAINNFAFDPFTETKVALHSDFPNMGTNGIDWGIDRPALDMGLFHGTNIIYDPTLTRVLYPKNNGSASLFNLETNQEIVQLHVSGRATPKWSPDGTELLIVRYNNENNKNTDEVVVDLKSKTAYKVAENLQPIGWMTKLP